MHWLSAVPNAMPYAMPRTMNTGTVSMSHAKTRVNHGVYASFGMAGTGGAGGGGYPGAPAGGGG